ncbi:MAG: hypothetical protein LBD07_04280 [Spirochaetaceae bacterium]|jgi:hypothetical protein|nr:hypothetical protein [Spirochaetaceae bacterium]
MKKKSLLIAALAVLGAGMGFAQGNGFEAPDAGKRSLFSVGYGLIGVNNVVFFKQEFKNEYLYNDPMASENRFIAVLGLKNKRSLNLIDNGIYLFFDAAYAQVDVSLVIGKVFAGGMDSYDANKIGFAFYGKYPVAVGKSGFTLAPVAGVQYDMVLNARTEHGNNIINGNKDKGTGILLYDRIDTATGTIILKNGTLADFNDLTIKFGLQARYPMSDKIYLDASWLYGITLNNTAVQAAIKLSEDAYDNLPAPANPSKNSYFNNGSTAKFAMGYVF